jgi:hypothetical protein
MALGLTQPQTEMSTGNNSLGGKGGRCVGLTLPASWADCLEIWKPQTPETLFIFTFTLFGMGDVCDVPSAISYSGVAWGTFREV